MSVACDTPDRRRSPVTANSAPAGDETTAAGDGSVEQREGRHEQWPVLSQSRQVFLCVFFFFCRTSLLIAMASNLRAAMASHLLAMASHLLAMASNLRAMASHLLAMASNLRAAMASHLLAMASNLRAMASHVSSPPVFFEFQVIEAIDADEPMILQVGRVVCWRTQNSVINLHEQAVRMNKDRGVTMSIAVQGCSL